MMVDVFPAGEVAELSLLTREVVIFIFGLYSWEYLISVWFEYELFTRRLPFKWPLVPYFIARYGALGSVIANMVWVYATKPINCNATIKTELILGNLAVVASSCNFMIRAVIIWAYNLYIVVPLVALAAGQVVLFSIESRIRGSVWNSDFLACVDGRMDVKLIGAFALYTTIFDLIILVVSLLGLKKVQGKSSFTDSLRTQGILYFVGMLVVHCPITVFAFAVSNPSLTIFSGIGAMTIGPIVSCRMVRATLGGPNMGAVGWQRKSSGPGSTEDAENQFQLSTHINLNTPSGLKSLQYNANPWQRRPSESFIDEIGLDVKGMP